MAETKETMLDKTISTTPLDQPQDNSLLDNIHALMTQQPYAVLCTQGNGQPYGSVIAYTTNSELNAAVFTTPIDTHKYRLLCECDQVAMVIDNRADSPARNNSSIDALTATGRAVRLSKLEDIELWKKSLMQRHPQMHEFISSSNNAFFRIDIQRYIHVTRLNEVNEWFPPQTA